MNQQFIELNEILMKVHEAIGACSGMPEDDPLATDMSNRLEDISEKLQKFQLKFTVDEPQKRKPRKKTVKIQESKPVKN